MKLYGSIASPYVRRIRMALAKTDYEFEVINIFDQEQSQTVEKLSPTKRIPLLVDGDNIIWDSLLIYEYLKAPLSIDIKKDLTVINEATDAGISLFQLRKFDVDSLDKNQFSQNNLKRIDLSLQYFEQNIPADELVCQWLFLTLDWFKFRNIISWESEFPKLLEMYNSELKKEKYQASDPRNA